MTNCPACPRSFEPVVPHQRFCSHDCKARWERGERLVLDEIKGAKWYRAAVLAVLEPAGGQEQG